MRVYSRHLRRIQTVDIADTAESAADCFAGIFVCVIIAVFDCAVVRPRDAADIVVGSGDRAGVIAACDFSICAGVPPRDAADIVAVGSGLGDRAGIVAVFDFSICAFVTPPRCRRQRYFR